MSKTSYQIQSSGDGIHNSYAFMEERELKIFLSLWNANSFYQNRFGQAFCNWFNVYNQSIFYSENIDETLTIINNTLVKYFLYQTSPNKIDYTTKEIE